MQFIITNRPEKVSILQFFFCYLNQGRILLIVASNTTHATSLAKKYAKSEHYIIVPAAGDGFYLSGRSFSKKELANCGHGVVAKFNADNGWKRLFRLKLKFIPPSLII